MAYEQPGMTIGFLNADVDMSSIATAQYTAVDIVAAQHTKGYGMGNAACARPTAGGQIIGIVQNNPVVGEAATIFATGVSMAKVSGAGVIGDYLMVDANGFFLKATTGNQAVARALETYQVGNTTSVILGKFGKV